MCNRYEYHCYTRVTYNKPVTSYKYDYWVGTFCHWIIYVFRGNINKEIEEEKGVIAMKKENVLGLLTIVFVMTMSMVFGSLQAEAYTYNVTGKGKNTTKTIYITKGEKTSLKLNYRKSAGKKYSAKKVTWKVTKGSSKAKILKSKNSKKTVKGKKAKTVYIKGLKNGTATIKTSYKGKTYTTKIVVESGLKLNKKSLELYAGNSKVLKVTNTKRKPSWSVVSGTDVVSVDANGKVTAIKTGSAKVQAKVGNKTFTCNVTVKGNSDFPYTVKWSMKEERLEDSTNSPWLAYNNNETTVIRGCEKDLSVSGIFPKSEKGKEASINKLNDFINSCTITSSNPSVATVDFIKGYKTDGSMDYKVALKSGKSIIATVKIVGVGTTTITLKTPKQTLTYKITGLKTALDLRDEQIAEFKRNYIKAGMTDYQKICKLKEYVSKNYKDQDDFGNQNPEGHEGEVRYMYLCSTGYEGIYYLKEGSCAVFSAMVGDFCHELGITCYCYYNKQANHEWNYLLLDGKWYSVDMSTSPSIANPTEVKELPDGAKPVHEWMENK